MRKAMVLGVLAIAGTLSAPAFADEWSGIRLGLNVNSEKLESDLFFAPALRAEPINSDSFGYGISGGWGLNKWLAFEINLHSGPEFTQKQLFPELYVDEFDFIVSHTDIKAADVTAVGSWWVTPKFGLFGRAGFSAWKVEQTVSVGNYGFGQETVRGSADDNGFDPVLGLGVQTALDGAMIRLEYQVTEFGDITYPGAFNLRDNTVSSLSLSLVWIL